MKHPCSRCGDLTEEVDLEVNPKDDDEYLCPRCTARSEQVRRSWSTRRRVGSGYRTSPRRQ